MKKRIFPEWWSYRHAVLHPESPPEQVNDLRNAFYGGCASMLKTITRISSKYAENKATWMLEEISRELSEYLIEYGRDVAKEMVPSPSTCKQCTHDDSAPFESCPQCAPTKPGRTPLTESPTVKGGRNDPPTAARPNDPQPQPLTGIRSVISRYDTPKVVTGTLQIEEYGFVAWCPTQDGSGPLEQLWLNFKISEIDEAKFAIRFKSRRAWDEFMALGDNLADEIWPDGGK